MKRDNFIVYLSELLLLSYIILFEIVITKYFIKYVDIINILFLLLLSLILYSKLGFSKRKKLINYTSLQTIFICFIIYYFLIYVFGLFVGFLSNGYSLKLLNIARNVIVALLIFSLKEFIRYMIAKKAGKGKYFPLIIITVLLALFDIFMGINGYDLTTGTGVFEFIESLVIPNLTLSALLSYISYKLDYRLALVFLVFYSLPKYFLPIFPDMGSYISSMVNLIFIFICYYNISLIVERDERKLKKTSVSSNGSYFVILIVVPLLIVIGLVSGVFKYHLFAIGSNSMLPVFARGDAVLIEKLKKEEYDTLKKGDIIAVYYNKEIIVHRIISITENRGEYIIKTKGDNNDSIDAWTVHGKDIYGRVKNIIKYIGLPSVELSELLNEKW